MPKDVKVPLNIKLPKEQVVRLGLLRQSLEEKMNRKMSVSDLVEKIIADFLE